MCHSAQMVFGEMCHSSGSVEMKLTHTHISNGRRDLCWTGAMPSNIDLFWLERALIEPDPIERRAPSDSPLFTQVSRMFRTQYQTNESDSNLNWRHELYRFEQTYADYLKPSIRPNAETVMTNRTVFEYSYCDWCYRWLLLPAQNYFAFFFSSNSTLNSLRRWFVECDSVYFHSLMCDCRHDRCWVFCHDVYCVEASTEFRSKFSHQPCAHEILFLKKISFWMSSTPECASNTEEEKRR